MYRDLKFNPLSETQIPTQLQQYISKLHSSVAELI
jgi:hypothetical protein